MSSFSQALYDAEKNPTADGLWFPDSNIFVDGFGTRMWNMHAPSQCAGRGCPIHNPSLHDLRPLRLRYKYDQEGIEPVVAERVCEHGSGNSHPDPDFLDFIEERHGPEARLAAAQHECDGCCQEPM